MICSWLKLGSIYSDKGFPYLAHGSLGEVISRVSVDETISGLSKWREGIVNASSCLEEGFVLISAYGREDVDGEKI